MSAYQINADNAGHTLSVKKYLVLKIAGLIFTKDLKFLVGQNFSQRPKILVTFTFYR